MEKYSIKSMCGVLKTARSMVYYKPKNNIEKIKGEAILENEIISEFKKSRDNYGTRKLKVELKKKVLIVSRRKIGKVMQKYALVSNYTKKHFKRQRDTVNEENLPNLVNREFDDRQPMEVVVSDLTYVNVNGKWNYICLLIDIAGREIVGFAAGKSKDAKLVKSAFYSVKSRLSDIEIFHTDRGSEFKNQVIDEIISVFDIKRSLSKKGCPYDNAVAEATYKIIKTEFAFDRIFKSLHELEFLLFDYVNWFNNIRIHGSLGYLSPADYKAFMSNKNLSD